MDRGGNMVTGILTPLFSVTIGTGAMFVVGLMG
jgi:hypothetical protein